MVKVLIDELITNQEELTYFDKDELYEMPLLVLKQLIFYVMHWQQMHQYH